MGHSQRVAGARERCWIFTIGHRTFPPSKVCRISKINRPQGLGMLRHGFAHEGEYGVGWAMMLQLGRGQPQIEGVVHGGCPLRGTRDIECRGAAVNALKRKGLLLVELRR